MNQYDPWFKPEETIKLRPQNKISEIKFLRDRYGVGLREAKEAIDSFAESQSLKHKSALEEALTPYITGVLKGEMYGPEDITRAVENILKNRSTAL